MKIAVLPGDGIGKEIIVEAQRVLLALDLGIAMEEAPVGGTAYEACGEPLPKSTLDLCKSADAILFGAVGDPRFDAIPRDKRPEQAILGLRKELGLFANLRPATVFPELADASSLRPEVVAGLDILILRELTGDIYFGQPRGIHKVESGPFAGHREGFDTMRYSERGATHCAGGIRGGAQARPQALLGGQCQRAGDLAALARSGDANGKGLPRC